MWRKPPKAIDESIRSLIAVAMILLGFVVLRVVAFGLPIAFRLAATVIAGIAQVAMPFLAVWGPKSRLERRYAQAIAQRMGKERTFIVNLKLSKGTTTYGQDVGALTLEDGCLVFEGIRTSFSIPHAQILPGLPVRGEAAWGTKLLVRVGEEPIGIEVVQEGKKATHHSLEEAFDRLWKVDSTGVFIPPPMDRPPSSWSGWRFPGWQHVTLWSAIYLFLIVQAIFQWKKNLAVQSNLTLVCFGTLLAALAFEILRIRRLLRETPQAPAAETCVPLAANSTSLPTNESAEIHVRA